MSVENGWDLSGYPDHNLDSRGMVFYGWRYETGGRGGTCACVLVEEGKGWEGGGGGLVVADTVVRKKQLLRALDISADPICRYECRFLGFQARASHSCTLTPQLYHVSV